LQGVDNMMTFEWLSPPPAELMVRGLETLHALGALGDDARLTRPLGALLADLPLPPHLGAALLAGAARGCGLEVATVAAALSVHSVWAPRPRREGDALRAAFAAAEGDLVTYLNVHRAWEGSGRSARWAGEHGVSHRALLRVADVRAQLAAHLRRLGVTPGSAFSAPPSSSSSAGAASVDVGEGLLRVRQALAAGLFMNAARLESEEESFGGGAGAGAAEGRGVYRLVRGAARPGPGGGGGTAAAAAEEPRLRIHPSSVLFRCRPPWVCFAAAQQTDSGW
jgi:ATP-dependent RNA helicase DDX35